jgi:hypothetical protein
VNLYKSLSKIKQQKLCNTISTQKIIITKQKRRESNGEEKKIETEKEEKNNNIVLPVKDLSYRRNFFFV